MCTECSAIAPCIIHARIAQSRYEFIATLAFKAFIFVNFAHCAVRRAWKTVDTVGAVFVLRTGNTIAINKTEADITF